MVNNHQGISSVIEAFSNIVLYVPICNGDVPQVCFPWLLYPHETGHSSVVWSSAVPEDAAVQVQSECPSSTHSINICLCEIASQ